MRALVFSDLQATEGSARLRSNPAVPLQRWRVETFYKFLAAKARELAVDNVIDLGDSTDDRSSVPVPTIQAVMHGNAMVGGMTKDWMLNYKLVGNHEQYTKVDGAHCGALSAPYFNVVQEPVVHYTPEGAFVLVPFVDDHGKIEQWLKQTSARIVDACLPSILLGHFQVKSCQLNSGISEKGVSLDALKAFDMSLLGHVHKHQQLTANGWYVGSPFQQNYGEARQRKFVALIDTRKMTVEWIPVTGMPEYRECTVHELPESLGEDRYKVLLRSQKDLAVLSASPHANHVDVEFCYAHEESEEGVPAEKSGGRIDVVAEVSAYAKRVPCDAGLPVDEVERVGLAILRK